LRFRLFALTLHTDKTNPAALSKRRMRQGFDNRCSNNNETVMKSKKKWLISIVACLFIIIGVLYYYLFSSLSSKQTTEYLYIDTNDNIDSVTVKLSKIAKSHSLAAFKILARHSDYASRIRTGRYAIKPGEGAAVTFRHLKNGLQTPVNLTIPSVRTTDKLAAELSRKLMADSADIYKALSNEDTCRQLGFDTATIMCLFIPNTYDIYWNTSIDKLFKRMKKEYDTFWNDWRKDKARQMGMTPTEVMTLASIVDEETTNDAEKPMVAGMYYNRLRLRNEEYPDGMPLQADPTIKFAWKKFDLHRIYQNLLNIDSPYNTYRKAGLPPGPIRIPSVAGIDAVLNYAKHDFLYMCAKEDFSGTHNFAKTYSEHLVNAKAYSKALNERGIK